MEAVLDRKPYRWATEPPLRLPYGLASAQQDGTVLVVPIPVEVAKRYAKATGFLPASVQILPTEFTFSFVAKVNLAFCGPGNFAGSTSFLPVCVAHSPEGAVQGLSAHVLDTFTINQLEQAEAKPQC